MPRTKIYVPRETAAVSVGADEVALEVALVAKKSGTEIELIRNGSWGATWLEPLLEVEVDGARIAYGNVSADDVASLFEAGLVTGGDHERRLGPVMEIPYLMNQDRWTFWRVGLTDPLSLEDFEAHHGFKALTTALSEGPEFPVSLSARTRVISTFARSTH
jgi:formate dehydrogenase iron-sulfur subunit